MVKRFREIYVPSVLVFRAKQQEISAVHRDVFWPGHFARRKSLRENINFCTGPRSEYSGAAKGAAGKNKAVYGPPANRPICKRRKDVFSIAKRVPRELVL